MEDYSEMTMEDIWTDEEIKQMDAAHTEMDKADRKKAIYWAFRQRCEGSTDYSLNRFERYFYTLKAIICLIFNIKRSLWGTDCVDSVCYWDYSGGYRDSWVQLNVGYGIFKNWHYDIYENSSY